MSLMSLQFTVSVRQALLVSFVLGFALRLIPELLAFPHPIGWDLVHYAYFMRSGIVWPHWTGFFTSTWLLYAFLFPVHNSFAVDSFLLLKIAGPVLFGFNVCGVYWFAKSFLGWDVKKSFLAAGFFSLQLASLRISYDLLRNTLGLGLLLFTLPLVKKLDSKLGFLVFTLLSLLTVFAHEYAAVTLLVTSLLLALPGLVKRKERQEAEASRRLIFAVLPALVVFLVGLYLRMFPVRYEGTVQVGPNLVWVGDTARQSFGKLFFFVNYLGMNMAVDSHPNYWVLVVNVLALFALLYLPYFFALQYWHRWLFMLVYPFSFYAVHGAEILLKQQLPRARVKLGKLRVFPNKVFAMVFATVLLGAIYLATPFLMVNVGFGIFSLAPVCRYFSSAPTVPYQDVDGTVQAVHWLEVNLHDDSCAVLHDAFAAWATLALESRHNVVGYVNDVDLAVDYALQKGYRHVYLVCWNEDIGWYNIHVPDGFEELQSFCRISVYEYAGGLVSGS